MKKEEHTNAIEAIKTDKTIMKKAITNIQAKALNKEINFIKKKIINNAVKDIKKEEPKVTKKEIINVLGKSVEITEDLKKE